MEHDFKRTLFQELENTRNKLADAEQLISSQDKLVKDLEDKVQENSHRQDTDRQVNILDKSLNTSISETEDSSVTDRSQIEESSVSDRSQTDSAISPDSSVTAQSDPLIEEDLARLTQECRLLQDMVQKLEEANATLQVNIRHGNFTQTLTLILLGGLSEERQSYQQLYNCKGE